MVAPDVTKHRQDFTLKTWPRGERSSVRWEPQAVLLAQFRHAVEFDLQAVPCGDVCTGRLPLRDLLEVVFEPAAR